MKKILVSGALVATLVVGTGVTGIASASASARPAIKSVTVPETVRSGTFVHAKYKVRPGKIQEIEPSNLYVSNIRWKSWSRTQAIGYGIFREFGAPSARPGSCTLKVPCRVTLYRVRSGHFMRMRLFFPKSPTSRVIERWIGTHAANSVKLWQDVP